jgi:hypothetical protein
MPSDLREYPLDELAANAGLPRQETYYHVQAEFQRC